jgi:hypothetical protein
VGSEESSAAKTWYNQSFESEDTPGVLERSELRANWRCSVAGSNANDTSFCAGYARAKLRRPRVRIFCKAYYIVIALFAGLSIGAGRRAGCHAICWMRPWLVLGRSLRDAFRWPVLRLRPEQDKCINCKRCTQNCPMSLGVNGMVLEGTMEDSLFPRRAAGVPVISAQQPIWPEGDM